MSELETDLARLERRFLETSARWPYLSCTVTKSLEKDFAPSNNQVKLPHGISLSVARELCQHPCYARPLPNFVHTFQFKLIVPSRAEQQEVIPVGPNTLANPVELDAIVEYLSLATEAGRLPPQPQFVHGEILAISDACLRWTLTVFRLLDPPSYACHAPHSSDLQFLPDINLSSAQTIQLLREPYLELLFDGSQARRGNVSVDFGGRRNAIRLVRLLQAAGPQGLRLQSLLRSVFDSVTEPNALYHERAVADRFLSQLRLKITTTRSGPDRGTWKLVSKD